MARKRVIIDCYTDEPAGLGVPPFLGTHPRIAFGSIKGDIEYLTIDDLRLCQIKGKIKDKNYDPPTGKTRTDIINRTREKEEVEKILNSADQLFFVAGLQTPGKYLSAQPAGLKEISRLASRIKATRMLTGPAAVYGTQQMGGASAESADMSFFNDLRDFDFDNYSDMQPALLKGAELIKQIPQKRIVEIETGQGCTREVGCSFCTEPLKRKLRWRESELIVEEVKKFITLGATHFRLGKQSCIYSYMGGDLDAIEALLKPISEMKPEVLHIDNANPVMITPERTELFVKYLTAGSTAAMGVESFDANVGKLNNLNSTPTQAYEAIKTINDIGGEYGDNGMPKLLPGINLLLGLEGETEESLEINFRWLKQMYDENLMIRRINIRQVVPFPGTQLYENVGNTVVRQNHALYADFSKKVRNEIDLPMLKRIFPTGHVIGSLLAETHEGNVTFLRQLGSYPIIVGVRDRLPLGQFYDVRITDHMLRSLTGEVI